MEIESMIREKCRCPLLAGGDPYFAGFVETDLGLDRAECIGPIKTKLGELACRTYMERMEKYTTMMKPIGDAAQEFLDEQ